MICTNDKSHSNHVTSVLNYVPNQQKFKNVKLVLLLRKLKKCTKKEDLTVAYLIYWHFIVN